jgi:hypothetical protein
MGVLFLTYDEPLLAVYVFTSFRVRKIYAAAEKYFKRGERVGV